MTREQFVSRSVHNLYLLGVKSEIGERQISCRLEFTMRLVGSSD